jgi:Ferrochelatase
LGTALDVLFSLSGHIAGPGRRSGPILDRTGRVRLQPFGAAEPRPERLAVVTPGFSADCLETLEEIGADDAGYFHEAGGLRFAATSCLNDSRQGIAVFKAAARRELKGWTE